MTSRMKNGQLNSREKARSGRVKFVEWRALFVAGTRRGNETRTYPASSISPHAIAIKVFELSRNRHIVELLDGRVPHLGTYFLHFLYTFPICTQTRDKSQNLRVWSKILSVERALGSLVYHAQRRVFETSAG